MSFSKPLHWYCSHADAERIHMCCKVVQKYRLSRIIETKIFHGRLFQFEAKIHNLKKQIISGSMLRMSEKKSLYVR